LEHLIEVQPEQLGYEVQHFRAALAAS